jgi:hypothetical protein
MNLTHPSMAANLCLLLPHVAVGIAKPNKATIGHFFQWFFCTYQKHNSILLWWGVLSRPLKVWPVLAGIANLIHSTAQRFATMGSGLFSFTRNHHAN